MRQKNKKWVVLDSHVVRVCRECEWRGAETDLRVVREEDVKSDGSREVEIRLLCPECGSENVV